ncbi:hypothetical protein ES703_113575 [subsurface metagenome]
MIGLDAYERHTIISRILSKRQSKSVLDVGGKAGGLQMFLNRFEVIALNIDDSGEYHIAKSVETASDKPKNSV